MNNKAKTTVLQRAKEIAGMREGMERKGTGDDFQILKNLLNAMEMVTGSLSLPNGGTSPLFLGLSIASIGLRSSESDTGIVGPSLSLVIDRLIDGFASTLMPEADKAKRDFLTMTTTATYILMIALALQSTSRGIGKFSKEMSPIDLKQTQFFAYELVLKLINSTDTAQQWFKMVIEVAGGNKRAQEIGGPILGQIGNLLMIIAGTEEGKKPAYDLISEEAKFLNKGIHAAIAAAATKENSELSEQGTAASLAIHQLLLALEQHNQEDFMEALSALLESLGTTLNALITDIQRLRLIPNLMAYLTEHAHDEEALTGIINIA